MTKKPCVIALGMFDSIHLGHKKIIDGCVKYAKNNCVLSVVVTFDNDVSSVINGNGGKHACVYTLAERVRIIKNLGANDVLIIPTSPDFLSKDKKDFLEYLDGLYDIKGYFCGFDYTFGKNAEGNVEYLTEYAKDTGKFVSVEPEITDGNEKISTSKIKNLLSQGNVEKANEYLPQCYFVTGIVEKDRGIGKKLGFPTVNISLDERKFLLKNAVYGGRVTVDKITYKAVINYGSRPTFGLSKPLLEAHLVGFSGDLYGKEITVFFDKFIREIKTFNDIDGLKEQLKKDVGEVK